MTCFSGVVEFSRSRHAAGALGCSAYPLDPNDTSEELLEGRPLRVGLVLDGGGGGEPGLAVIEQTATSFGTTRTLVGGDAVMLLDRLKKGELDAVIGRFPISAPWSRAAAFSKAIGTPEPRDRSVPVLRIARPHGENRFILITDRIIAKWEG